MLFNNFFLCDDPTLKKNMGVMLRFSILLYTLLTAEALLADNVLDWDTATCRVIENSCRLHNAADSYEASEALKSQSLAFPNPQLGLGYDRYTQLRSQDANEYSVQLNQLVELGGKRTARYALANSQANEAAWDWESVKISLLNELSHAFVNMAAAEAELKLAQEKTRVASEVYQTLSEKAQDGMASRTQLGRAKLELATTQIDLRRISQNFETARINLANVWHGVPDFCGVAFPFFELRCLPNLCDYLDAIQDRPDVAAAAWNVESAYAIHDIARTEAVPDVIVSLGYNFSRNKQDSDVTFGLLFPLPIFNRNKGNITAASYRADIAQRKYNEYKIHLCQAVRVAYQCAQTAFQEALALQELVNNEAAELYQQFDEIHREGKIDYLSLLEAQRAFFDIKSSYIEALARFHNCKSDLDYLIAPEE